MPKYLGKPYTEADLLEDAWAIICNAGGSDWEKETSDWQDAVIRYRTKYFRYLDNKKQPSTIPS